MAVVALGLGRDSAAGAFGSFGEVVALGLTAAPGGAKLFDWTAVPGPDPAPDWDQVFTEFTNGPPKDLGAPKILGAPKDLSTAWAATACPTSTWAQEAAPMVAAWLAEATPTSTWDAVASDGTSGPPKDLGAPKFLGAPKNLSTPWDQEAAPTAPVWDPDACPTSTWAKEP